MNSVVLLVCAATLLLVQPSQQTNILELFKSWTRLEFAYPSAASRHEMLHRGLLIENSTVPLDIGFDGTRWFISTPRFRPGVPATISTLSLNGNVMSPLLVPYPSWGWHNPDRCDGFTSVLRFKIDECGRIWILDTGSVNIFTGIKHLCPKSIRVFELATDKQIRRHRFPQSVIKPDTILTTIAVDVRDRTLKCRATYAYVADTTTYGLIVYDARHDRSWRITANNFWPIPHFGRFSLHGTRFTLMDGILGLTLSPHNGKKPRTLYYQSLASDTLNYVSTTILMNHTLFKDGAISYPPVSYEFKTYPEKRYGQSAVIAMAPNGVLFYSELTKTSLNCFNTRLPFKGDHNPTLESDVTALQFNTGIKVVNIEGTETLLMITNRLQKLFDNTMDYNDVNFRILVAPVNQLIAGTNCAVSTNGPVTFPAEQRDQGIVFRDHY